MCVCVWNDFIVKMNQTKTDLSIQSLLFVVKLRCHVAIKKVIEILCPMLSLSLSMSLHFQCVCVCVKSHKSKSSALQSKICDYCSVLCAFVVHPFSSSIALLPSSFHSSIHSISIKWKQKIMHSSNEIVYTQYSKQNSFFIVQHFGVTNLSFIF